MSYFEIVSGIIKGKDKVIFFELVQSVPLDLPFWEVDLYRLFKNKGGQLSSISFNRYLRYLKDWNWGIIAESLGKGRYALRRGQ